MSTPERQKIFEIQIEEFHKSDFYKNCGSVVQRAKRARGWKCEAEGCTETEKLEFHELVYFDFVKHGQHYRAKLALKCPWVVMLVCKRHHNLITPQLMKKKGK